MLKTNFLVLLVLTLLDVSEPRSSNTQLLDTYERLLNARQTPKSQRESNEVFFDENGNEESPTIPPAPPKVMVPGRVEGSSTTEYPKRNLHHQPTAVVRRAVNLFSLTPNSSTTSLPMILMSRDVEETRGKFIESPLKIRKIGHHHTTEKPPEDEDENVFEKAPGLFTTDLTTARPPSTSSMDALFMIDTEDTEETAHIYTSTTQTAATVTLPVRQSTIVDNSPMEFLPSRRSKRQQVDSTEADYDDDFDYPRRRPYYMRSPLRHRAFYFDDYDFPNRRPAFRRFPLRRRPLALPAPNSDEEDVEEEWPQTPTASSAPYSTLKSGLAGAARRAPPSLTGHLQAQGVKAGAGLADSKMGFIPAPLKKTQDKGKRIQMSSENCRKVNSYAKMFGVTNPQKWVRHNCPFVQSFVKASCKDINAFVDSCFFKQA